MIVSYADACLGENSAELVPVGEHDVRATGDSTPVTLESIKATANVNALLDGAELTLATTGLTIVYGDNGSGKSGFARVLKQAVRARAAEKVHTDVFERPAGPPTAEVIYSVGGTRHESAWTEGAPSVPDLSRVSFFDGDCGAVYPSRETDAAFRPFGLDAFDSLAQVCEQVKAELDRRTETNSRRVSGLPALRADTKAAAFLGSLSRTTSDAAIEDACSFTEENGARLKDLRPLVAAAESGSAGSRAKHLTRLSTRIDRVAAELEVIATRVDTSTVTTLSRLWIERLDTGTAAAAVRESAVNAGVLPGIGDGAWRTLWDAARAYSEQAAYAGQTFPVTEDAACVLCHQPLTVDAQQRLLQFEAFVTDHAQQAEDAASAAYEEGLRLLAPLAEDTATSDALADLQVEDPEAAREVASYLEAAARWLADMQLVAAHGTWQDTPAPPLPSTGTARSAASQLRANAGALAQTEDEGALGQLRSEMAELDDRRLLHQAKSAISAERNRLARAAAIADAKSAASTNAITQKSVELTNVAVTDVLVDRFSRETDRLGLERVVLSTVGGRRGVLRYRTRFVGAVQDVPLPEVLSEGEQTALGLAGFLAEVWTEASKSCVVLDDPVSSLDHERRDKVAQRIAQLGQERQVVVFSHDIAFVRSLKKHADATGVPVTSRSVERIGSEPGHCSEHHKFSLKLMGERLKELQNRLATLENDSSSLTPEQHRELALQWYRLLRRTWERCIEDTLLGTILTRDSLEVHPRMVRVLTAFTVADNKELQLGYGRATEFAEMHDESDLENRPAPSLDDLREDLQRILAWHKRIDLRRNMSTEKLEALAATGQTA